MPRLARSALFLAAIFAGGTLGYGLIEGASWWDAFYMTAITLTTVGYGEVFPLSRTGEVFTVAVLFSGFGLLLLVATDLGRSVVEGELQSYLGHMRRTRMLGKMSGHEIVCGWGRMGQAAVAELLRNHKQVVVVESNAEKTRRLEELGIPTVAGDATAEAVLKAAGVERARGLVACLNDDAHNVYTVLTARSLNPKLHIVARAGEEGADARLLRAGANRVVNPYHHGGVRLAHLLSRPAVVDFVDFSLGPADASGLQVEQLRVDGASTLAGRTLAEVDLRRRCGVGVVALRRGEQLIPNPEPDLGIAPGDVLVVVGSGTQLARFEEILASGGPSKEE
ncbi:MAG: potassium channel protein [Acidobacteriota bacterium]